MSDDLKLTIHSKKNFFRSGDVCKILNITKPTFYKYKEKLGSKQLYGKEWLTPKENIEKILNERLKGE